jgi:phosphoribosylamine--glycine ligase
MRIVIVGGGGREHALAWKLAQSPRLAGLWCAPGNPGTGLVATNLAVPLDNLDGLVAAARRVRADLVVIGPEAPLAAGLGDRLRAAGIPVCGPSQAATQIEASKRWAKELMRAAEVPTARATVVTSVAAGLAALPDVGLPVVVKADGLAAGKGVVVAATRAEAETALRDFLEAGTLGEAGRTVVIEEYLRGPEASVFALSDGERFVRLPTARDHKRVFSGDQGPNTGGMGAYTPTPALDEQTLRTIDAEILGPIFAAMAAAGARFQGVLFAGLMLTAEGPKVIEFNARFGDPETQAILPVLDGDLVPLLHAVAVGDATGLAAPPAHGAAVGVVLAAGGYPGRYATGRPIAGLDRVPDDVLVFHAGTRRDGDGRIVTAGGRVLTVVGLGPDLASARARAYAGAAVITFEGCHYRTDIALSEAPPAG